MAAAAEEEAARRACPSAHLKTTSLPTTSVEPAAPSAVTSARWS